MPTERNWKQPAKTSGLVATGAALVGAVTWLVLPPTPRTASYGWQVGAREIEHRHIMPSSSALEVTTNGRDWSLVTNLPVSVPWQTNRVTLPADQPAEFYRVVDHY